MNLYAYCGDDPVNLMDPSGLMPDDGGDSILPPGVDTSNDFVGSHEALGGYQQAGLDASSFLLSAVPGIGPALGAAGALTGCDPISGRNLSPTQRAMDAGQAALSALPLLGSMRGLAAVDRNEEVFVIGRTQSRVNAYAKAIGAKAYRPWNLSDLWGTDMAKGISRNRAWIRLLMRRGVKIIDIGQDSDPTKTYASPFYSMEQEETHNYPNLYFDPQH